ncbi:hypothetical protein VTH06DRAFT_994 [Thermothelomyces fergusii]
MCLYAFRRSDRISLWSRKWLTTSVIDAFRMKLGGRAEPRNKQDRRRAKALYRKNQRVSAIHTSSQIHQKPRSPNAEGHK